MPHDPGPHWGEVGIHGIHRGREWDAVATCETPDDRSAGAAAAVVAVALSDGRLHVEAREGEGAPPDLRAFADAVGLAVPFRLEAVRRAPGLWVVGARRIEVVRLAEWPAAETVELVFDGRERMVTVDGRPTLATSALLEEVGARHGAAYVVTATRLLDDLWEVSAAAL